MKFKPNSKLPKGGKLLPEIRSRKAGSWSDTLRFDASCERLGLTWLRVKGGFLGKNNREDWVADLPSGCLSVCDYNWNKGNFGYYYGSFDDAIISVTERHIEHVAYEMADAEKRIAALRETHELVLAALKRK